MEYFKFKNSIILALLMLNLHIGIFAQSKKELYGLSEKAWQAGDFKKSAFYLNQMLLMKDSLTDRNKIAIFNRLGMINDDLGRYNKAISQYKIAEGILIKNYGEAYSFVSLIYNNMAISYKMKGDYEKALEYYKIALFKLEESPLSEKEKKREKSKLYLNLGILYSEMEAYPNAILSLKKSMELKLNDKNEGLENVYLNLARAYEKIMDYNLANEYYNKCIKTWEVKELKGKMNRSAATYMDYATFLLKTPEKERALGNYHKSLKIYMDSYGLRHPFTSNCFHSIGTYYLQKKEYKTALSYFQKALISDTKEFSDTGILSLPKLKDVISDRQLIKILRKKAEILILFANASQNSVEKRTYLKASIESAEFSLYLISEIRQGYLAKSSKLSITSLEKAFYFIAADASIHLFEQFNDEKYKKKAYTYIQKSKASFLRNEIAENKAFASILPDSIRNYKNDIEHNIYSYKKLIYEENQKNEVNEKKIIEWSNHLFKLNQLHENLVSRIKLLFPEYNQLIDKSNIVDIESLQNKLNKDESIIEYSLSPPSEKMEKQLLIFVLTRHALNYYKSRLDSTFEQKVAFVRNQMNNKEGMPDNVRQYNEINKCRYQFYEYLIKPVKHHFKGNKIYVIPDEEIAYLSFDALQKSYTEQKFINYASVPYLIYDYCFSYAYSSSLLFQTVNNSGKSSFVYAFAPDYEGDGLSNLRFQEGKLENTEKEIKAILKWFNGKALSGRKANEEFFKKISAEEGIFHFAMHASTEKSNPDFSFLAISRKDSTEEDGLFYNYEISMMKMKARMVVLSGCNTGDGIISSGEGLLSLSRNFILAGVPSIVHSLWEVQDEISVEIMAKFYEYLSKGYPKNIALHKSKLDYIQNASPAMVNPYFWSGYVLIGNPAPVVKSNILLYSIVITLVILCLIFIFIRKNSRNKRNKSLKFIHKLLGH